MVFDYKKEAQNCNRKELILMKRVCIVVPSFSAKGGITSVVNGYRGSKIEKEYSTTFIETYCDGCKIKKVFKAICSYMKFVWVIISKKPDVLHIHSSFGGSFYRKLPFIVLGHMNHIPIINHIHGSEFDKLYTNAGRRKQKRVRSVFNKCSCIIVLSDELKEQVSKIVSGIPIIVINNYSVTRPEYKRKKNLDKSVLFMGFVTKLKGCYDIPLIARKVVENVPNVTFIVAGAGDIESIRSIAIQNGVEEHMQFPGWIVDETKESFLSKSDVFFLPSYTEAMPMSILEAMGYGLPIVSTRVGGIPKLVEDGYNGFLYEPGDIDGASEGLIRLLKDEELLDEFGRNGYNKACTEFSYEHHISRIMDVYREALQHSC